MHDDVEERTYKSYVADCMGTLMKVFGSKDIPLYSEMLDGKKKEITPQAVVDHVRNLFK